MFCHFRPGSQFYPLFPLYPISALPVPTGIGLQAFSSAGLHFWMESSAAGCFRAQYSSLPWIFFPETAVLFNAGVNLSAPILHSNFSQLYEKLFYSAAHVPTVVLILAGFASPLGKLVSGERFVHVAHLFRWYYEEPANEFAGLDVAGAMESAKKLARDSKNEIPWRDLRHVYSSPYPSLCPFTLSLVKSKKSCAREELILAAVAFANLNSTGTRKHFRPEVVAYGVPAIKVDSDLCSTEVLAPAEDLRFGLITSDGLQAANDWINFAPLYGPFQSPVWAATLLLSGLTAWSITWLHNGKEGFVVQCLSSCYCIFRVLLLQSHLPAVENRVCGRRMMQMVQRKVTFIWGLWLLSAMFLISGYGCMFSSNYILEPTYTRDWNSSLLPMNKFTVLVGFEKPLKDALIKRHLTLGYYFYGSDCFNVLLGAWLTTDPRRPCSFLRNHMYRQGLLTRISTCQTLLSFWRKPSGLCIWIKSNELYVPILRLPKPSTSDSHLTSHNFSPCQPCENNYELCSHASAVHCVNTAVFLKTSVNRSQKYWARIF